jgi:predicted O-linked N-acetylglucosamine transferase (SPINDLY family)
MLANVTDPTIEERVVSMFALAKITPNRLMLKPRMPTLEYLALHHQIDVALDPFPYNGGTTSIHSLWMGIPVITLGGEHTISRVGTSILSQLGLHNLIAKSEEEYLKIAITLTKDLQSINSLRQSLRGRMQAAAGERIDITRALEVVYREVWEKWCDQ